MIEFDNEKFGKRLKQLRIECGMSQNFLAKEVGVAQNTITQYESGYSKPKIDVLVRLAIVLKTTTDYLLGLED